MNLSGHLLKKAFWEVLSIMVFRDLAPFGGLLGEQVNQVVMNPA